MSYSCTSMVAEIKARMGRTGDTGLISDARVRGWLNEAQDSIASECPGLPTLEAKNTTSVDWTQSLSYNLSEFTSPLSDVTTSMRWQYLWGVWFLDGQSSYRLQYLPIDEFDAKVIDPTHSDHAFNKPLYWTRRGNIIEAWPLSACEYCDKDFRLDGQVCPIEFSEGAEDSTAVSSSLAWADEGLISYTLWKAWRAIGGDAAMKESMAAKIEYEEWVADYRSTQLKATEWDQNIYGEWE